MPPQVSINGSSDEKKHMLKYAALFLIISMIAGAAGLANVSMIAKRISMFLFALFFLIAAVLFGLTYLVGEAITHASLSASMVARLALSAACLPAKARRRS